MNINIYNAIASILEADISLTKYDKETILAVCKHPRKFINPGEKKLPRLLTIKEATSILKISRCTLWRMGLAGTIQAVRFRHDGVARYCLDDIEALIANHKGKYADTPPAPSDP